MEPFDVEPEWRTFWIFIETQIKKHQPECYTKIQKNVEIIKLNEMAQKNKWEIPIGLR